jgi:hypothetical protein
MKVEHRLHARELRKKGKSINEIVKETGYVKASVSFWVRDIVLTQEQKQKLSAKNVSVEVIEKRRTTRLNNENNRRLKILQSAKKDYNSLSEKDLKLIGIIIYLGEGAKTKRGSLSVANSDPDIIRIMILFLRKICKVPNEKFRCHIHTFSDLNIKKAEQYWSTVTGIPTTQFYKTYAKPSKAGQGKRLTLPYGTLDLSVHDTKLYLTMLGWIEKIKEILVSESV